MKLLFVFVALSLAGALRGVQVSPVEIGASSSAGMSSWPHRNLEVSWGASRIGRLPNAESFPSLPSESGGFRSMTGPSVALVGRKVAQRLCVDCNKSKKKKKKGFGTAHSRAAQKDVLAVAGFLSSLSFFPVCLFPTTRQPAPSKQMKQNKKTVLLQLSMEHRRRKLGLHRVPAGPPLRPRAGGPHAGAERRVPPLPTGVVRRGSPPRFQLRRLPGICSLHVFGPLQFIWVRLVFCFLFVCLFLWFKKIFLFSLNDIK